MTPSLDLDLPVFYIIVYVAFTLHPDCSLIVLFFIFIHFCTIATSCQSYHCFFTDISIIFYLILFKKKTHFFLQNCFFYCSLEGI